MATKEEIIEELKKLNNIDAEKMSPSSFDISGLESLKAVINNFNNLFLTKPEIWKEDDN